MTMTTPIEQCKVLYKYSVDRLINRLFNDTTMRNLYDSNSAIEKLLVQSQ